MLLVRLEKQNLVISFIFVSLLPDYSGMEGVFLQDHFLHSVPFTLFRSLCSFHSVPFTLFLYSVPFTLFRSLCSFH